MNLHSIRFLALAIVALTSGCATLFAPGPDRISVQSMPAGARVFLDHQEVGVTPMTLALDRKLSRGSIRIEAPGYQPVALQRAKTFNAVALINCLSLIPWVVDLATGNYEKFDTTPISVSLMPGYGPPGYPGQPTPVPAYPPRYPPPPPGRADWGAPPPGYPPPQPPPYPPQPPR